jgi:hypothetical protein
MCNENAAKPCFSRTIRVDGTHAEATLLLTGEIDAVSEWTHAGQGIEDRTLTNDAGDHFFFQSMEDAQK